MSKLQLAIVLWVLYELGVENSWWGSITGPHLCVPVRLQVFNYWSCHLLVYSSRIVSECAKILILQLFLHICIVNKKMTWSHLSPSQSYLHSLLVNDIDEEKKNWKVVYSIYFIYTLFLPLGLFSKFQDDVIIFCLQKVNNWTDSVAFQKFWQ